MKKTKKKSTAVAVRQPQQDSFLAMLERAARDPAVDVAKMEQLLAMRDREQAKIAEQAFDEAMTLAQQEMRPVQTDSNNPQTKSKYASFLALDHALRPIYSRHGFALSFNTTPGAIPDTIRITCQVSRAGHSRHYQVDMPVVTTGIQGKTMMTQTHATASAITYGRRYLLLMVFNIAVGDDDGNAAGAGPSISDDQIQALRTEITNTESDEIAFCNYMGVPELANLPASRFAEAKAALESKKRQMRQ